MAVDASMRKLKIPPKFMPYMEKHRIYELFHDLGNELALNCPEEPLSFIKTCLERMEQHRNKRLVIMLAPPFLDRIKLAHLISVKTGCNILSRYLTFKNPLDYYSPVALAKKTSEILHDSDNDSWILADFPDTVAEAEELIQIGVLPTHTFLLLSEEPKNEDENVENVQIKTIDTTSSLIMEYDNCIYRMRELFKSSLKVVKIKGKSIEELANDCARLTMKMPIRYAPKIFRIVLIGPRGSRRTTLAKILSKQFKLVHVDMKHLINMARVSESSEGDTFRYLDRNYYSYPLKIVFDLLKSRLAKEDCVDRGYVLTNFPTSVQDFVLLDSIETPPNRVIFLDIEGSDCQERIEDRVVNMYDGTLRSRKGDPMNPQILTHPDDESCKVENEIKFYNERVNSLREYCGETHFVVDATGPINALLERVEDVLMGPPPAANPRTGKIPEKYTKAFGSEPSTDTSILQGAYPRLTRAEVVPMIDSADLLRRFSDLKKVEVRTSSESSRSTDEGDLIMRELDLEFERALKYSVSPSSQ